MKLTADTITDEQIRELRSWGYQNSCYDTYRIASQALKPRTPKSIRESARARCAEILNARGGK